MKHNLVEKRIKQLFHELRQGDELRTPSFDRVLKAASSKVGQAGPAWLSLRVAVAAALLILVSGLVFILLKPSLLSNEPENSESSLPIVKMPNLQLEPLPGEPLTPSIERARALESIRRELARSAPRKRPAARSHQQAMLISEWQSPTNFLLRTPGEQLLKMVPRVGESLFEIKPSIPDEKN
jgi:hypothetical protein